MIESSKPSGKRKIAILGGGMGSLAAAYWLTSPRNPESDRLEVTVYQLGWRLGGKGASGVTIETPERVRVEEHGPHLFFGYYDNVIRTMKLCYEELSRPQGHPLADFDEAFTPQPNGVLEQLLGDRWHHWAVQSPGGGQIQPAAPEDVTREKYFARLLHLGLDVAGRLIDQLDAKGGGSNDPAHDLAARLTRDLGEIDHHPLLHRAAAAHLLARAAAGGADEVSKVARWLEKHVDHPALAGETMPASPAARNDWLWRWILRLLHGLIEDLWKLAVERIEGDSELAKLWTAFNFLYGNVRGMVEDGLIENGFDVIDDQEYSHWLEPYLIDDGGLTLYSAWTRINYAMLFAYERGELVDTVLTNGNIAAGASLRTLLRLVLDSKRWGMLKMTAGCGDSVFAPLYQVLTRRGVEFRFFHNVKQLHLAADRKSIAGIELEIQATTRAGAYRPLVRVKGLPCWPAEPLYDQLVQGEELRKRKIDLESWWTPWPGVGNLRLEAGKDFDDVVLGLSLAPLPCICRQLIDADPRWKRMVERVKTVRTQAAQLWFGPTLPELGWPLPPPVTSTYDVSPVDTWVDGAQVIGCEIWPPPVPGDMAYLCGPMADDPSYSGQPCEEKVDPAAEHAKVRAQMVRFLEKDARQYWPKAYGNTGFDWDVLAGGRFESQYWVANVNPSARYVQSVAGSTSARLLPGDSGFANLVLAGDWTRNALNTGTIEATTSSGMMASSALTGYPQLEKIVGLGF